MYWLLFLILTASVYCPALARGATMLWEDASSGTGQENFFALERGPCPTGPFTEFAQAPQDATSYPLTVGPPGSTECFRMKAVNSAGSSPYSNVASYTTPSAPIVGAPSLTCSYVPTPPPPPPSTGLVLALNFNEGAGSVVTDSSPARNNGTLSNATWTGASKYGKALVFNGNNSRVTIPNAASLQASTALTVSAWIFPSGTPQAWSSVVHKVNAANYVSYGFGQNAGNTRRLSGYVQIDGVGYATPMTNALTNQTWYYVVLSWQNGQAVKLTVYTTAGAVFDTRSTQALSGTISYDASPLYIGEDEAGDNWAGTIDDVRIYARALSAAEIGTDRVTPVP